MAVYYINLVFIQKGWSYVCKYVLIWRLNFVSHEILRRYKRNQQNEFESRNFLQNKKVSLPGQLSLDIIHTMYKFVQYASTFQRQGKHYLFCILYKRKLGKRQHLFFYVWIITYLYIAQTKIYILITICYSSRMKIRSIGNSKSESVSHPIYYFIAHINCAGLTKSKRSGYLFGMR